MASIFNEQRVRGVRVVSDGTIMHNNVPVVGVVSAPAALHVGYHRTLGVDVLPADTAIYNDQQVWGVVLIGDARTLYNGREVIPVRALSGVLA